MEQHPVPQQISSYEFKLVGDMTLKQFIQLATGVGVAFIIFVTPLPDIIKWPFAGLCASIGAAVAFLPFQGRSLTNWLISFIKATYSPTHYTWQEGAAENVFYKDSYSKTPQILAPQGEKKAQEYLANIPQPKIDSKFEEQEQNFFKNLTAAFQAKVPSVRFPAPVVQKPQPAAQVILASIPPLPQPKPIKLKPQEESKGYVTIDHLIQQRDRQEILQRLQGVTVPQSKPVHIQPQTIPNKPAAPAPQSTYKPEVVAPVFRQGMPATPAVEAFFAPQAAPPAPPEYANVVVGQVISGDGRIVDGAILEIQDSTGIPVRALKTNKVGHFIAITPLKEGEYELTAEKEGMVFEPIKFKVAGEVIPPILVKGKFAN